MAIKTALLPLAAVLVMGCAGRGLLYTSTIEPYACSLRNTPFGTKSAVIHSHRFKEPVTGLGVSGEWDSDIIMRAAREAGITSLHYIDIETFSLLMGTYRRQSFIVYGD